MGIKVNLHKFHTPAPGRKKVVSLTTPKPLGKIEKKRKSSSE
jgi:hypothetical protein